MKQLFKDKKYWKDIGIILLLGIIINVACFFMCSFTGHCANENPNDQFPYQIGIPSNVPIPSEVVNQAISNYITILSSQYGYDGSSGALCFLENNDGNRYIITCCDELTFDISGYPTTFVYRATHQHWVQFVYNADTGVLSEGNFYGGYVATWTFSAQSLATTSHGYILGSIPSDFYASYGSSTVKVWTKNDGNIADLVGEFVDLPPLSEILDNIQSNWQPPSTTGHALPSTPQENTNNTPFQDRLQMFQYLADTVTQNFGNLGYNLQNFFNKLNEKLTNVGNAISTNIHNGFSSLMQNIKDFFGPKIDKLIELLTRLVNDDEEDVKEVWESTQLYEDFDSLSQFTSTGFAVWEDTTEPNTYKIPFHVEQIPLLNCDEVQYIDLGLFSPVIPYIRSIMWALMVYSVFYTVVDSLANYINGGDE